jgi:hypothetical protein
MIHRSAVLDVHDTDADDAVRLLHEAADVVRRMWQHSLDGASIDEVSRLADAARP